MNRLSNTSSLALRTPMSQGMLLYSTKPPRNSALSAAKITSIAAASIQPA